MYEICSPVILVLNNEQTKPVSRSCLTILRRRRKKENEWKGEKRKGLRKRGKWRKRKEKKEDKDLDKQSLYLHQGDPWFVKWVEGKGRREGKGDEGKEKG